MEERVPPPDGKEDPPLDSPSFKKYPLPRPPPPARSRSKTVRNDPRLTKSQDSFSFPLPPSVQDSDPDPLRNINNLANRLFNPSPSFPVSSTPPPLPSSPERPPPETYVVQIPKEQIFRVPPPENATRYESFRRPQKKKCPGNCCLWILIALVTFGLLVGLGIWMVHHLYNPKSPRFSITNVNINLPAPSSHQKKNTGKSEFDVALRVENPNKRLSIVYDNGGTSSLSFKKHVIAEGNYPSSSQETKERTMVKLTLPSSNAALSPEIQKSINDTKTELSFRLVVNVPIKFTSWMKPVKKDLFVTCDFKVKSLRKGSQISDQQCTS